MPTAHKTTIIILALVIFGAVGCDVDPTTGYTTRDQYVQNVRSVCVPMWNRGRDVYRRDLEFRITESIVKEIQANTKYKISEEARADTILTGEIIGVSQEVMAFNPDTGNPREKEITITLAFTWTDLRNGKMLAHEDAMEVTGTYIPDFGEDFFQGSQDVLDEAARQVVRHMEADW